MLKLHEWASHGRKTVRAEHGVVVVSNVAKGIADADKVRNRVADDAAVQVFQSRCFNFFHDVVFFGFLPRTGIVANVQFFKRKIAGLEKFSGTRIRYYKMLTSETR
jgi:hypothetical protein